MGNMRFRDRALCGSDSTPTSLAAGMLPSADLIRRESVDIVRFVENPRPPIGKPARKLPSMRHSQGPLRRLVLTP